MIRFHSEDIAFKVTNPLKIKRWIKETIAAEKHQLAEINYIFCSDEYLHKINVAHLDHDDYTDVITFPYSEKQIEGDIFISIERIKENATNLNIAWETELHRVLIHGALHLCGYTDKTPEDKELMTAKENFYLALLTFRKKKNTP